MSFAIFTIQHKNDGTVSCKKGIFIPENADQQFVDIFNNGDLRIFTDPFIRKAVSAVANFHYSPNTTSLTLLSSQSQTDENKALIFINGYEVSTNFVNNHSDTILYQNTSGQKKEYLILLDCGSSFTILVNNSAISYKIVPSNPKNELVMKNSLSDS